jgi:MFS family permease
MFHHRNHQFHFFGNKEVTSLYFTIALVRFSLGLVTVFIPIYLWELGYSIWQILSFFALESLYLVLVGLLVIPLLRRMSDKSMLITSIPLFVLYALALSQLGTYAWLFFLIPLFDASKAIFFNTGYHLDFAGASDKKDLGKEIGLRFMLGSLVALMSPFVGGLIIARYSFPTVFIITAILLCTAIIPLIFFPKRQVSPNLSIKKVLKTISDKKTWAHAISNIGYANEFVVGLILWKLYMYIFIGDIEVFGALISLSLFVSAFVTFIAGAQTDNGKRKKVLTFTAIATSLVWLSRIWVDTVQGAAISHVLLHAFYPAMLVAWSSIFYHLAKNRKEPTAFILGREIFTSFTRVCFYLVLIPLAYFLPSKLLFPLSFMLAGCFSLLLIASNWQKYSKNT